MNKKVLYYHTVHSILVLPSVSSFLPFLRSNTKTLYMHLAYSHPLNEHFTRYCSLHSLLHKGNPYLPCYFQHTIQTQLMHSTVSTFKTTISAMLMHACTCSSYSNYIAAIHNVTHSPCTSTLHTHHYLPHCIPQLSYAHNQHKA